MSFLAHTDAVLRVTYSADGRLLATAGGRDPENNIGIWEASTGKLLHGLQQKNNVLHVAFSPDGWRLAATSWSQIVLWDVATGEELRRIPLEERASRVAFSPDGKRLATASESQTVRLLDADSGKELAKFRVSGGELWGVAFSPDGRYLATCSGYKGKGTLQIWDAGLGK
jgi:WD40 repeat protein